jgi:small subunit ribosomal protein S2
MSNEEELDLLRKTVIQQNKYIQDLKDLLDTYEDIVKEHIAVAEARRLNIPTFAIVDTNSNPNIVDYPIPANDDAAKSISLIINVITAAIQEGLSERKHDKDKGEEEVKAVAGEESND